MTVFVAVLLVALAALGLFFFALSRVWMIVGIALAAASVVMWILHKLFLCKGEKEKIFTGIQVGLLTLSALCLALAGAAPESGGYNSYQAGVDRIAAAYEDGDSRKADRLMQELLGEDVSEKDVSTEEFIRQVRSAAVTDEQKDELLSARAGYLHAQKETQELKALLDAMADKTSERYYGLTIAYLHLQYEGASQEETLYQELAKTYGEAADQYLDNYDFQLGAGIANIETGDYYKAQIYLENARALTADPVVADLARAVLLYRAGNTEGARLFLEDVKTLVANGYGPADIQEGIDEVQGWLDAAR